MSGLKERFIACIQNGAKDLDASGFDLPQCPKTIEENIKLHSLVRLNLGFNKIRTFPDLRRLSKLCILHLSSNLLSDIDTPSFASLTKLRELTINGNTLVKLPESVGNFTKLEKLDISNNRLTYLPNEIGYLCSLVELRCSGNPIREVPRTIRDCNCLETINFDFCNIDRLCSEITYCSRLLDLSIAKNNLTELPRDMGRMTRLTDLNVSDNKLRDLPISMGMCKSIGQYGSGVAIEGNPITNQQLLKARAIGSDHVLYFLEKRMTALPGGPPKLQEIPWHGLLQKRDQTTKKSTHQGTTLNLGSYGNQLSAAPSINNAQKKQQQQQTNDKVLTLKRWAHEQINNVYIPKIKQIKMAIERVETVEQASKLVAYMQRVSPVIQNVADLLPMQELSDEPKIASDTLPLPAMKARLNWACTIAKEVLEGCEIILESSSYAETIVDLVRALKALSEIIK